MYVHNFSSVHAMFVSVSAMFTSHFVRSCRISSVHAEFSSVHAEFHLYLLHFVRSRRMFYAEPLRGNENKYEPVQTRMSKVLDFQK